MTEQQRNEYFEKYNERTHLVDRTGLIMDISTVFSTSKINVENMNMRATADGFAIITVTFAITDATQLEQLMRKLHQISSVMDVRRPAG